MTEDLSGRGIGRWKPGERLLRCRWWDARLGLLGRQPGRSSPGWRHVPSHTGLLAGVGTPPTAPTGLSVDLLVVPTSRPGPADRPGVRTAVELARSGCVQRLLVVCSKAAATPHAVAGLEAALHRWLPPRVPAAVTVVTDGGGAVPAFDVDRLPLTSAHRRCAGGAASSWRSVNDVGLKRNLAVMLAARLGASRLLFLDDDVSPAPDPTPVPTLDPATLRVAMSALDDVGLTAVGWSLRGYADNSVVCRARILTGHDQDQFIGGGALLVREPHGLPFFPAIYNEDWLFLLGAVRRGLPPGASLGWGGVVLQDAYDGLSPGRARSEELGDILGEGLMSVLHDGRHPLVDPPDHAFWREVIAGRRRMIRELADDLVRTDPARGSDQEQALAALQAALTVHAQLDGRRSFWIDQFARYVSEWQVDLDTWRRRLAQGSYDNADILRPFRTLLVGDAAAAFEVPAPSRQVRPSGLVRRPLPHVPGGAVAPIAGLVFQTVRPSGWRVLRDLRLRALHADSPHFLGSFAEESTWDERRWRAECRAARWFCGSIDGVPVALARVKEYPEERPQCHLESMWVTPELRGQGLARELLSHVEGRVRGEGEPALGMWVFEGNHVGRQLYTSMGYTPTGRSSVIPDGRLEVELQRRLLA